MSGIYYYNQSTPYDIFNYNMTIAVDGAYDYNFTVATNLSIFNDYGLWFYNQSSPYDAFNYNMSDGTGATDYTNIAMTNQTNTFSLNQTLSDELILSQDKSIYMGAGRQYYNGSCMITVGSSATFEVC